MSAAGWEHALSAAEEVEERAGEKVEGKAEVKGEVKEVSEPAAEANGCSRVEVRNCL